MFNDPRLIKRLSVLFHSNNSLILRICEQREPSPSLLAIESTRMVIAGS